MNVEFSFKDNYGFISGDREAFVHLRNSFSVKNPNPKASPYNKILYAINPAGRFDLGLSKLLIDDLTVKYSEELKLNMGLDFISTMFPSIPLDKEISKIDGFNYYDYQEESIKMMFNIGRGIINLPTGAGKGLVMAGFCKTYIENFDNIKILLLVPNLGLLNQLYSEFKTDYGLDCVSKWSGDNPLDLTKSIIIANTQIVLSDLGFSQNTFKHFDSIIVDECHKIKKNNTINKFLDKIKTHNKFGLTGTIPKEKLDEWNVIGKLGPIIYSQKSYDIRDNVGSISDVEIKVIRLKHKGRPKKYKKPPDDSYKPTGQYENEIEFIYNKEWRNNFIVDISTRLDGNVLILVDRLFHGEKLLELLKARNSNAVFIHGDIPIADRIEVQNNMEKRNDITCVAMSSIFSTGISIKNLKYVIFVCIGKSYTKVLQSIGRSLRLHENKKKSIIFDISDYTPYSEDHLNERLKFYTEEKINYEIRKIEEKN